MNNLPIWIAVWNANNHANSGVEMSTTEATVAITILSVITLAFVGYFFYDLNR